MKSEHRGPQKRKPYKTNQHHSRNRFDFFPTPRKAIVALLEREIFRGSVWEPTCGDLAMVNVLEEFGYDDLLATDIQENDDFFDLNYFADNIITNPPYNEKESFIRHSKELATYKVAMLLPLASLSGKKMYEIHHQSNFHLIKVYPFSTRLSFGTDKPAPYPHAWFIWQRFYNGSFTTEIIPPDGM